MSTFFELKQSYYSLKCLDLRKLREVMGKYYECEFKDDELNEWIAFGVFLHGEIALMEAFCRASAGLKNVSSKRVTQKTYLMTDKKTGFTKIGTSANPLVLERTLQSENPSISLIAISEKNIKKFLHKQYADKRVRGEWFALADDDISNLLKCF